MHWKVLLIGLAGLLPWQSVSAAPVATDNASNLAYSVEAGGAWKGLLPTGTENPPGSDNGGYGFLPWNFEGGLHDGTASPYANLNHFIDGVDFAHSSFNNLGSPAFGLTNANVAYAGFTSRATRVFAQPLEVGGTISIAFDNPMIAPLKSNDQTGYVIRLNSGGGAKLATNPTVYERLGFFAYDGFNQGNWNRADASGSVDTGLGHPATTAGAIFQVTLQSAESYLLQILPLNGGNPLYTASGNLASNGMGSIDTIEILMFGNGSGNGLTGASGLPTGQREFFVNSLLLNNPQTFLSGDYNRDGTVTAADYIVWRATLNQSVANGTAADGNWDGAITQLDYAVWRQNFGMSSAASSMNANTASAYVPEPNTFSCLLFAVIAANSRRFRRTLMRSLNALL